jgi:lipopolysaccharide/colanic/teichoic acid biosynthesis glycosyltransferase
VGCVSSATGLLLLLPLFALVAVCIKVTSCGPVFYRQTRVGKGGRQFQIVKFRSMDAVASEMPAGITVSGDKRITRVGRILRRYKIDELPQLWNVLCGDMSLVGPRPELPKYVEAYSSEQKLVLCVRPGITDPASLAYRHEEEILSRCGDPEQMYQTQVLPDKLARNLAYIRRITFRTDLRIIFATMGRSFLFVGNATQ